MKQFLLPSIGDPLNFNYWLKNYDNVWRNEVDGGIVSLLSPIQDDVVDWYKVQCEKRGFQLIYKKLEQPASHGTALGVLINALNYEDDVVILEDDTLFNRPGNLTEWFRLINAGVPLVGASRNCIDPRIIEHVHKLHGISGEVGFQTAFLVLKASILKDIGAKYLPGDFFGSPQIPVGAPIDFLGGYVLDQPFGGDCFDAASLEILNRIDAKKIHKTVSWRGQSPNPVDDFTPPFINIGSLSIGICLLIRDSDDVAIVNRAVGKKGHPFGKIPPEQKWQYERSMAWFMAFSKSWEHPELLEFKKLYDEGIERFISEHRLDEGFIRGSSKDLMK